MEKQVQCLAADSDGMERLQAELGQQVIFTNEARKEAVWHDTQFQGDLWLSKGHKRRLLNIVTIIIMIYLLSFFTIACFIPPHARA